MKEKHEQNEKIEEMEDNIRKLEEELAKLKESSASNDEDENESKEEKEEDEEQEPVLAKNIEFNNEKEDLKVIKEDNETIEIPKWVLFAVAGVLILIIVVVLLLSGGKSTKKQKSGDSNGQGQSAVDNNTSPSIYKSNSGVFSANKYIVDYEKYVVENYNTGKEIKLLKDANVNSKNMRVYGKKDDLYVAIEYSIKSGERVFVVKKISNDTVTDVLEKKCSNGDISCGGTVLENGDMVGFFENGGKKVYLFNDNDYKKYSLTSLTTGDLTKSSSISLYDGNYIIVDNGLYDIKNDKKVIDSGVYELLVYAGKGKYIASDNYGNKGIVNETGKVLLDFDYVKISPLDKYFVVSKSEADDMALLDSNYNVVCSNTVNNEGDCFEWLKDAYYSKKVNNYYIAEKLNEFTIYTSNFKKIKTIASGETIVDAYSSSLLVTFNNSSKKFGFYNPETGENLGAYNNLWKNFGDYKATFRIEKEGKGTLTITKGEEEIGKIENASFSAFVYADNNGITLKEDKIIYNAIEENRIEGDLLIIKR